MAKNGSKEDEWYIKHVEKLKSKRKESAKIEEKSIQSKEIEGPPEKTRKKVSTAESCELTKPKALMSSFHHPRGPWGPFGAPRNPRFNFQNQNLILRQNIRPLNKSPSLMNWTPPRKPLMGLLPRPPALLSRHSSPRSFRPRFSNERFVSPRQSSSPVMQGQRPRMKVKEENNSQELATKSKIENQNELITSKTSFDIIKKLTSADVSKEEINKTNTPDVKEAVVEEEAYLQMKKVESNERKKVEQVEQLKVRNISQINKTLSNSSPQRVTKVTASRDANVATKTQKEKQNKTVSEASKIMSTSLSLEEKSYLEHLKTLKVGKKMNSNHRTIKNITENTSEKSLDAANDSLKPLSTSAKKTDSMKIKSEDTTKISSETVENQTVIKKVIQDDLGKNVAKPQTTEETKVSIKGTSADTAGNSCLHTNKIEKDKCLPMDNNVGNSKVKTDSCDTMNDANENREIFETLNKEIPSPNLQKNDQPNVEKSCANNDQNATVKSEILQKNEKLSDELSQIDLEKPIEDDSKTKCLDISNEKQNKECFVAQQLSESFGQSTGPLEEPTELLKMPRLKDCSAVSSSQKDSIREPIGTTPEPPKLENVKGPENTVLKVKPSLNIQPQKRNEFLTEFSSAQPVSFSVSQVISSGSKPQNLDSEFGPIGLPVSKEPQNDEDSDNISEVACSTQESEGKAVDNSLPEATDSPQACKRARIEPEYRTIKVRTTERKENIKRTPMSNNLINVKITKDVNLNSIAAQQDELSEISESSNELYGSVDGFSDKMTGGQDEIDLGTTMRPEKGLDDFVILDSTFDVADEESFPAKKRPTAADFFESLDKQEKEVTSNAKEKATVSRRAASSERMENEESGKVRRTKERDYRREKDISIQPMKIAPSTYFKQENYDSEHEQNVDGLEYIQPISGYHCTLCQEFFFDNPTAMHHCTLLSHKMKVVTHEAESSLDFEKEIDKELDFIEAKKRLRKRRFKE